MWDRAVSVMKERNPDVRAITERSTSQFADILRLRHDERKNQREITEITELNAPILCAPFNGRAAMCWAAPIPTESRCRSTDHRARGHPTAPFSAVWGVGASQWGG